MIPNPNPRFYVSIDGVRHTVAAWTEEGGPLLASPTGLMPPPDEAYVEEDHIIRTVVSGTDGDIHTYGQTIYGDWERFHTGPLTRDIGWGEPL